MEFSVLMSVYKEDNPAFFRTALESVTVNQTLKPKQVVIVQDGVLPAEFDEIIYDVENTAPEIIFTVIKREKNSGLAVSLNIGIDACICDWIARMDSDDISDAERFEKQVKYIEAYPDTDVLGGAIAEFNERIGDIKSERHVGLTLDDIKKMAKSRTPMNHITVMYRKKAVTDVGKYCENFGKLEDYKLWVDMLSKGKSLANIDDILCYVRIGNGFIGRRSNKREIADWDMLQTYLLKSNLIGKFTAVKNRLYIRVFIYMPSWAKKLAYKCFLR